MVWFGIKLTARGEKLHKAVTLTVEALFVIIIAGACTIQFF